MPSRLYCLEPIGVGTPLVESLTGYITRLAEAHSIFPGDLITEVIAPVLNKPYLSQSPQHGGNRFYDMARSFNGMGSISKELVSALESLTLIKGLRFLTLANFQDIISSRDLLHPARRWCPTCLEEWKTTGGTIYEPLIWNIKCIEHCPVHLTNFTAHCPVCKRRNAILARNTMPGLCSYCGKWLGMKENSDRSVNQTHWRNWINDNVTALLGSAKYISLEQCNLFANLNWIVQYFADGKVGAFARSAGIPKSSIWSWYHNNNLPSLESVLKISYCTQIPLIELLTQNEPTPKQRALLQTSYQDEPRKSRPFKYDNIEKALEDIIAGQDIMSMQEVARRIGWDKRLLYKHFPELCKAIAYKHAQCMETKRKERAARSYQQVQDATQLLISAGIFPSRRRIEKLDPQICLRETVSKQAWHEMVDV